MQSKGEDFDKEKFIYACKMCEQYKLDFISSKESLGFTDKFEFMETNHFVGFSIVDGKFVGDVTDEQLFAITDKWYYGFPVSANHYQFEVSCYAMTQFDTEDRTGMLYKDFKNN
ncbi:hypothetical protein [Butyrivibrio hungatei]|nr:hypothetical protein [Butyrivibrio hungatei]